MNGAWGPYTALSRIDRGIGAKVWKAIRNGPGGFAKLLALKEVAPEVAQDADFVKQISVVSHLVHPNVVQVLDFERLDSEVFLAMEYVPGCDLGRLLDHLDEQGSALSRDESLYLVLEIVRGLRGLHERATESGGGGAILHGGLSPGNVLLSWEADVKVTDFCKSRTVDPDDAQLGERLAWMSPEQAGAAPLDERSDLFSAGLLLYVVSTGRRLFTGETTDSLAWSVLSYEGFAENDTELVDPELRAVLTTALQPRPEDRFADARAFETALSQLLTPDAAVSGRAALVRRLESAFGPEREIETRDTDVSQPSVTLLGDREEEPTHPLPADAPPPESPRTSGRSDLRPTLLGVALLLAVAGLFVSERSAGTDAAAPAALPAAAGKKGPVASAAGAAKLSSVSISSRTWVEVWIDGKRIGKGTPIRSLPIKAGKHMIRLMNPEIGFILETTFWVPANRERKLHVDASAGGLKEL